MKNVHYIIFDVVLKDFLYIGGYNENHNILFILMEAQSIRIITLFVFIRNSHPKIRNNNIMRF